MRKVCAADALKGCGAPLGFLRHHLIWPRPWTESVLVGAGECTRAPPQIAGYSSGESSSNNGYLSLLQHKHTRAGAPIYGRLLPESVLRQMTST